MKNIHFSLQLQQITKYQAKLKSNLSEDAFDDCSFDYYHVIVDILEHLSKTPAVANVGAWDILEDVK